MSEDSRTWTIKATGNTYPYREDLQSWGFLWRPNEKAWIREGCDSEDARLFNLFARGNNTEGLPAKWPGVFISVEAEASIISREEVRAFFDQPETDTKPKTEENK